MFRDNIKHKDAIVGDNLLGKHKDSIGGTFLVKGEKIPLADLEERISRFSQRELKSLLERFNEQLVNLKEPHGRVEDQGSIERFQETAWLEKKIEIVEQVMSNRRR